MKLTLHDCFVLIQRRLEALNVTNDIETVEWWDEMAEIVKQGRERAQEAEANDEGKARHG